MTQRSSKRRPAHEIVKVTGDDDHFIRSLVMYEDADLLVFNKPSGLAVQGGSGVKQDLDRLLWAFATRKGRRPKLVHRIDRATSGVLVVAKTSPAAAHLSAQFAQRTLEKSYLALVSGSPTDNVGSITAPLVRTVSAGVDLMRVGTMDEKGALGAHTDWAVAARGPSATLLEVKPLTGRMHQIRAHLAHIGHPIYGDDKYGGLLTFGTNLVPRLMLHAHTLTLIHPTSGEAVTFTAPAPDALTEATG
jgi:23S rRNA pseudouridine955/2504/2580 synthase